jgi:predicted Fe-S protein YdhL (DUF1289 family)
MGMLEVIAPLCRALDDNPLSPRRACTRDKRKACQTCRRQDAFQKWTLSRHGRKTDVWSATEEGVSLLRGGIGTR